MPKDGGIGASSKRREDIRFLTGEGNYTDDINLRGQAHVFFLRSDIAHGTINKIDTSAAEGMPGVVKVFTAADFEGVGSIPCGWQVTDKHGEVMQEPAHPVLASGSTTRDMVRHGRHPRLCAASTSDRSILASDSVCKIITNGRVSVM